MWTVVAVLALAVMPAPHLHRSISGKPLIHSHLIADPIEHAGTLDHGNHYGVRTLGPMFTPERTTDWGAATVEGTAVVRVMEPGRRSLGYLGTLDAPASHGPPLRVVSLRAPPA